MEIEERWSQIPIEYRDKVYGYFHKMNPDEPIIINEKVSPENREGFKVTAAYFIRWDEGRSANFIIEFNNDYTKIRKLKYFSPTPNTPIKQAR